MRFRRSILACAAFALVSGCFTPESCPAAAPRAFVQETIPISPTVDTKRPATIEAVRFGFDGFMLSDAWAPVRIYVSGNPAINAGAFAGTVTIDFTQDATQSASITTSFATTPGRIIPVEIIAAIPRGSPTVRVQIHDQSGRFVQEKYYSNTQFGEAQLPARILDDVHLVVVIADKSGSEPSISRALRDPESVPERADAAGGKSKAKPPIDEHVASCVVRDDDLPMNKHGFDGVAIVAARSDVLASLSLPKASALGDWVQSGGCLVVLAGADPQTWLPRFWAAPPIEILEPSSVNPDPDLVSFAGSENPLGGLRARVVRLTRPIAETAWRIEWGTIQSVRHDGEPLDGLLAQGPAGFGWIVVLGLDPALLGSTSAQLTRNWKKALRHALAEAANRPWLDLDERWRGRGSGPDGSSRAAMKSALDSMADIPALGDGAFVAIAVFLILLAFAVGPVDAIVLRRLQLRAWSWATALGWIALASALAAVVPPLIRSGKSTSHRLRVIDIAQSPDGEFRPQQTSLTSLFANASSSVAVFDPDHDTEVPVGWFRGVSASHLDDQGRSQPLAIFATVQTEIRTDGGARRINSPTPLSPLSMGQWTLRSFMTTRTDSVVAAPVVVLAQRDGAWVVTVRGLSGSTVEGSFRIGTERFELASQSNTRPEESLEFRASQLAGADQRWDERLVHRTSADDFEIESPFTPGTLLELSGARERTRAADALIASGGWACVYLLETGNTPSLLARDVRSRETFAATESTLWRILVPLAPSERRRPLPLAETTVTARIAPARKAP